MFRYSPHIADCCAGCRLGLALCALLALGLAGCGGDEPSATATPPAPAPAPPPFQSQPVEVALGESGGTATLMTTEAGGFTLNGEAFEGGTDSPVEGEGGRRYVLTLADGTWSAAFLPMEVMVALGNSGESVTLMTTEAGGFTMGGEAVESGGMTMNSSGANYTLTMGEDGTWMAAFMPMTQTVTLGTSGMSVELMSNEAGMWMIGGAVLTGDGSDTYTSEGLSYGLARGDDGMWAATFMPVTRTVALGTSGESVDLMSTEDGGWAMGADSVSDGFVATADSGDRYTLYMRADGTWMAAFAPMSVPVMLGGSGETVTLMTTEGGGFTMNGQTVDDGSTAVNSAGQSYALSRAADGTWSAIHQPVEAVVDLGSSGESVRLMTTERGGWTLDGAALASGDTVTAGDNAATGARNEYQLTLTDGKWTATYQPMRMTISGTSIEATAREDGSGYTVGNVNLPATGVGEVAGPGGAMYRVSKDADGMLVAMRYDMPMVGDAMHVNAEGEHGAPSLKVDDHKTSVDETGTELSALGANFSMGDLLGRRAAVATGPNIVAKARGEIVKIRDRVAGLVALRQDDGISRDDFNAQLTRQWEAADTQVRNVFGGTEALERTTSESRVVDAFDRLVDALSSEEAFAAATLVDGPDKLQGFHERTAEQAAAAFNRVKWTAEARLGELGSTRFGIAMYNSTDDAKAAPGDAERAQAFAWSTMDSIRRSTDVQMSGTATYDGRTHAVDKEGSLYAGDINVAVGFTNNRVDGLVTGFADMDSGEPWTYGLGGAVTAITLPTATMNRRGAWQVRSGSDEGRLSYAPEPGGSVDEDLSGGAFSGQLLGRDDLSGTEVIGTWKVEIGNEVLAGAFGATRGTDRPNPVAALADNLTADGAVVLRADSDGYLDVPLAGSSADTRVLRKTTIDRTSNKLIVAAGSADEPWVWASAVPTKFEVGLEDLFGDKYLPVSVDGFARDATREIRLGSHVDAARKEITRLQRALEGIVNLGNEPFANQQRQRIFDDIQEQITTELFREQDPAPGLSTIEALSGEAAAKWNGDHTDYPANSAGEPSDRTVLAEVQSILDALADQESFGEAFASGGIFEGLNAFDSTGDGENDTVIPAHFIFRKDKARMLLWTDTTDVSRFGVWIRQSSFYANNNKGRRAWYGGYSGYRDLTTYGEPFAYSPLDQVTYASHMDRGYPGRGAQRTVRASYEGTAAALQHTIFYTADLDARVWWDNNAVSGQLSARFSEPTSTDPAFGRLRHGLLDYPNPADNNTRNKPKPGTHDVAALIFTADITSTDNKIGFTGDTLRVEYDREIKGNRSYPELVAPVINKVSLDNGNLKIRHSGQNESNWRRREAPGTWSEVSYSWLNTSDLPADNTTTVVMAGTGGTETLVDRFNAEFEDHAATSLDLYSVEYGRYDNHASKEGYLLLTFVDGTLIHTFVTDLNASGSADNPARTQSAYGPSITVSQGGELFDEFFSSGKGARYLNVGYPLGPPVTPLGAATNFDRTQFFAQEFEYEHIGDRYNGFGRPMDPAEMARRGIDIAGGTPSTFYTTSGSSTVGLSAGVSTTARIDGQFVGEHSDGPLGMIGVWSLPGNSPSDEDGFRSHTYRDHWFGVGNMRAEIVAAFGADLISTAP